MSIYRYKKKLERKLLRVLKEFYIGKGLYVDVYNISYDMTEAGLIKDISIEYGRTGTGVNEFCENVVLTMFGNSDKYLAGAFFRALSKGEDEGWDLK